MIYISVIIEKINILILESYNGKIQYYTRPPRTLPEPEHLSLTPN
jgi:hypothetical protein